MNTHVVAAVSARKASSAATEPGEPVFLTRDGKPLRSIRTAFATACRRAGLGRDVTPHTLRHSFGSRLVMAGVDLRTVQELGGWKRLEMVLRYSHLSEAHKADAVERLIGNPEPQKPGINSQRFSQHRNRLSS